MNRILFNIKSKSLKEWENVVWFGYSYGFFCKGYKVRDGVVGLRRYLNSFFGISGILSSFENLYLYGKICVLKLLVCLFFLCFLLKFLCYWFVMWIREFI